MQCAAVLSAGLFLVCGDAFAQEDPNSANFQMPGCRSIIDNSLPHDAYLEGACVGAVRATVLLPWICPPAQTTALQIIHVVVRYIDSRPARLNENFNHLVAEALKEEWACPIAPRVIIGAGNDSCETWTSTRQETNLLNRAVAEGWILAFLSGMNMDTIMQRSDALLGSDVNGLEAWTDNYCRANPGSKIGEAAGSLMLELRSRAEKR